MRNPNLSLAVPVFSLLPTRLCIALHACPCGYYGDPVKPCTCLPGIVTKYQKRISGPLLDRIDIHIEVPRVEYGKLSDQFLGKASVAVKKRVEAARHHQRDRFQVGVEQSDEGTNHDLHIAGLVSPLNSTIPCNSNMRLAFPILINLELRQFMHSR